MTGRLPDIPRTPAQRVVPPTIWRVHIGQTALRRRALLKATVLGAALACSPAQYRTLLAGPVARGAGPYGALLGPDANGLLLPKGFRSRIVAVSGLRVGLVDGASPYVWHTAPDGAACFPEADGGWRYVNNSEVDGGEGGVGGEQGAGWWRRRRGRRVLI